MSTASSSTPGENTTITGFRLAPSQAEMWRRQADGRRFVSIASASVRGDLDVERLVSALAAVSARHDILRAVFRKLPGMEMPLHVIEQILPPRLEQLDWHGVDSSSLAASITARPWEFDGREGPLWRASLARINGREHLLFLSASSLIADAQSLRNIVGELADNLNGTPIAPPSDVQFLHYSEWCHEMREGADLAAGRAFWDELGDIRDAGLVLPFERPHAASPANQAATARQEVVASAPLASMSTVLVSWAAVLARRAGGSSALVHTRLAARPFEELRHQIGPFAEFAPVRLRWEDDEAAGALAQRVERWLAVAVEQLPFADRVRAMGTPRLGFVYEAEQPSRHDGSVSFADVRASDDLAESELLLHCQASRDQLRLMLRFDPERHDEGLARRLIEALAATLSAFDSSTSMARLAMLGRHEHTRVVYEWNKAAECPHDATCIHEAFEAVVAAQPDALAVVAPETSYTYAALDARANQTGENSSAGRHSTP